MRFIRLICFLSLMGCFSSHYGFAERMCEKDDAIKAEEEADRLDDWDSVYRSYKRFAHCDTGAISEGYSDSISKLLAHDWKSFPRLYKLTTKDKRFTLFLINHIDDTIPKDVIDVIIKNAHDNCPKGAKMLCMLIEKKARQ
jgi:hypothetical protein